MLFPDVIIDPMALGQNWHWSNVLIKRIEKLRFEVYKVGSSQFLFIYGAKSIRYIDNSLTHSLLLK